MLMSTTMFARSSSPVGSPMGNRNSASSDYLCSRCGSFGENGEYETDDHGEEFCLDCYAAKKSGGAG